MEMKAIVTGASSGIGREICKQLAEKGWKVYGIGREFTKVDKNITQLVCDITDTNKLTEVVKQINNDHAVSLLVNNAGVGYYGLHEELNSTKISQMVRTNLEAPMVLTNILFRDIKKNHGYVINISSITAEKTNPHGCAYGATKAGITSFSKSLFEEARKYGVRVVNIEPDMTSSNLYRNADFAEDDDISAHIEPNEVANAVMWVLEQRDGLVVTDVTIRPQLHRIKKKKIQE